MQSNPKNTRVAEDDVVSEMREENRLKQAAYLVLEKTATKT